MGPSLRIVDCIAHHYTGVQMLHQISKVWKEYPKQTAVILQIGKGEASAVKNTIRVALSRERNLRGYPRTFELRFSDPIPCEYKPKVNGVEPIRSIPSELIVVDKVEGSITTILANAFMRVTKGDISNVGQSVPASDGQRVEEGGDAGDGGDD